MKKQELRKRQADAFMHLLDVMDDLREKCPWDRKQTMETLRPQTIEETFELSDAIIRNDMHNIMKELGDVLLHIVFYSKIGEEQGQFNIADVMESLCAKLIYRHPHVYACAKVNDAEQVVMNWEQLKTIEKDGNKTVLGGVPESLPSLIKAYRMQDKARAVGFDWEQKEQVWEKVQEELEEFKEELKALNESNGGAGYKRRAEGELGDLLFSIVNAARLYDLNPDTALEMTNRKFRDRFTYLESRTIKEGVSLRQMSLEQMDKIWEEAKTLEKRD